MITNEMCIVHMHAHWQNCETVYIWTSTSSFFLSFLLCLDSYERWLKQKKKRNKKIEACVQWAVIRSLLPSHTLIITMCAPFFSFDIWVRTVWSWHVMWCIARVVYFRFNGENQSHWKGAKNKQIKAIEKETLKRQDNRSRAK